MVKVEVISCCDDGSKAGRCDVVDAGGCGTESHQCCGRLSSSTRCTITIRMRALL